MDTIVPRHDVGLGTMATQYRLPGIPLVVSVLEIDVSNPYVDVMSVLSHDSLGGFEPSSGMARRKSSEEHEVLGGVNADFFTGTGHPVNGQILKGQVAKEPDPERPLMAFDGKKQPFLDRMSFEGSVTIGEETMSLDGVNTNREDDQLIFFNQYYGSTTSADEPGIEVVVELSEGDWKVNQPLTCTVKKIREHSDKAALSPGKAVLSGHGTSAEFLRDLEENDELEIEFNVSMASVDSVNPALEEMVGGDRIMLDSGKVVDNNWAELHPRTGAGFSRDKSKVILTVVDGRDEPVSIGVTTSQLAEIMKLSGAWWAINLDGGGSSTMMVRDSILNSPSDGAERKVANALFFASAAPQGEAVDFKLNADHLTVPAGQKITVKASTFDKYGDVVSYLDAPGVTYSVDGDIGTINDRGEFVASGKGEGMITGKWKGKKDTVQVMVVTAAD